MMAHALGLAVALGASLLAPSLAAAQRSAPLPISMDRVSGEPRLGVELGLVSVDTGPLGDDFFAGRFDVSGHFVSPRGVGGYGSIVGAMTLGAQDDESAVQGLELGGLFRLDSASAQWWLRGGLVLGTADDDLPGVIANYASFPARLTDLIKVVPDTTWLRASATPIFRTGDVTFRFDLGLDVPIDDGAGIDSDPILRANAGLGFTSGRTALLVELINSGDLGDNGNDGDDFVHTLSFGARFLGGQAEPHIALGVPLDDGVRDFAPFFLLVGLSARL